MGIGVAHIGQREDISVLPGIIRPQELGDEHCKLVHGVLDTAIARASSSGAVAPCALAAERRTALPVLIPIAPDAFEYGSDSRPPISETWTVASSQGVMEPLSQRNAGCLLTFVTSSKYRNDLESACALAGRVSHARNSGEKQTGERNRSPARNSMNVLDYSRPSIEATRCMRT